MKTNRAINLEMTGQTSVTFPDIGSLAEARSVSRPGEARRCAGMRLDTDLSDLGTQSPFIRGMSWPNGDRPLTSYGPPSNFQITTSLTALRGLGSEGRRPYPIRNMKVGSHDASPVS